MKTQFYASLFVLLLAAHGAFSQSVESRPGPVVVCPPGHFQGHHYTPPSPDIAHKLEMKSGGDPCANIVVTYNGFTTQAQNTFQAAVDIWAASISSPVTIRVNATWEPMDEGVLGAAGPSSVFRNFANAPDGNYYPSALADAIAGTDLAPFDYDLVAWFNSDFDWHYGTDGNVPSNKFDLVSVVLHELGHGLGFISSRHYDEGTSSGSFGWGSSDPPLPYDEFLTLGVNGTPLLNISSGIPLGNAFTSGNVYCNSDSATTANGGNNPKIYAPGSYGSGSSISHWDEVYFPAGSPHSLMTPMIGPGEAIHNPGGATIGLFRDMGWPLCEQIVPTECETGNPLLTGPDAICPGETTGLTLNTPATIPPGGGFGINFYSPALDDGIFLYGVTMPYTFDNDLNGVLSANGYDPFSGLYELAAHVYTDPNNPQTSICASSAGSVTVTFHTASDAACNPEPDCATGNPVLTGPDAICPGETTGLTLNTPATIPPGGGFGIYFYSPALDEGLFLYGVTMPYTFDNDLNGVLSANGFDPFSGLYELTARVYTDPNNPQTSICASSAASVAVTFHTASDAACNPEPDCATGNPVLTGPAAICPGETTGLTLNTPATIPPGGGFGIYFYSPALDEGLFLYGVSMPYTFDNDLNGVLSANGFDPFSGLYELTARVYTDPNNPQTSICASSAASVAVTFHTASDAACNPEPDCATGNPVLTGPAAICPGETTGLTLNTPATIPPGGGFGINFYSPVLDDGIFLYGVTMPYTFDNDLNGVLSANGLDPFSGLYELTAHVYTDPNNPQTSICASSAGSVTVTFHTASDAACIPEPVCETDVLVITGPTAICPLEVTEVMLDIPADIPSGGGYAIEFHNPAGGNLPYLLTGVELPFTFDYSLNGELPSSGTDPFFGEYQLTGYVYHDANDPSGSICAQSSQSVTVTFHNFEEVDCIDSTEDESFFKNFWSVYPNPARDVVHVECFSPVVSGGHISLMDIQGKRLLEKTFTGSEQKAGIQLDVAGMAPGIYFLRMEVPRGTHTRKLVIGQR